MGKSKPDQVIVHRIDLQPGVKQSLEDALMINSASKVMQGVGTAIGGIAQGLGAFMAAGFGAYVVAWGAGQVKDKVLDPAVERNRANIAEDAIQDHQSVTAFVSELSWGLDWGTVGAYFHQFSTSELGQELQAKPPTGAENIVNRLWLFCQHFWKPALRSETINHYIEGTGQWADQGPKTPQEAWADWYTVEEVINDSIYVKREWFFGQAKDIAQFSLPVMVWNAGKAIMNFSRNLAK